MRRGKRARKEGDSMPRAPFLLYFYWIFQILALVPAFLFFLIPRLFSPKYRAITLKRLFISDIKDIRRLTGGERNKEGAGEGKKKVFWVHALSFGEVRAGTILIEKIAVRWPDAVIWGSSSTPDGLRELEKSWGRWLSGRFALPFDLMPIVNRAIAMVRPDVFILIETDIWPTLVWRMRKSGAGLIMVNGSISQRAASRLERFPWAARLLYGAFSVVAMQSMGDMERLLSVWKRVSYGKSHVGCLTQDGIMAVGSMKFDAALSKVNKYIDDMKRENTLRELGLRGNTVKIVAGSTHSGEEELIISSFVRVKKGLKDINGGAIQLFIAPRDIKRAKEIGDIVDKAGLTYRLRTEMGEGYKEGNYNDCDVVIFDTLGELLRLYSICDIAIIGGTFVPVGGHNAIEPASMGLPVISGPYIESILGVMAALERAGGGLRAGDERQMYEMLNMLVVDNVKRRKMGKRAGEFVIRNGGVVDKYLEIIDSLPCQKCTNVQ